MTSRVTAAPTFVILDGKDYEFSPLTDKDLDELNEWMQTRVIQLAQLSLLPSMTPDDRKEVLDTAMEKAGSISYLNEAGRKMMSTVDGARIMCWLSLREYDVTLDAVKALLTPLKPKNLDAVNRAFVTVNVHIFSLAKNEQPAKNRRRARA